MVRVCRLMAAAVNGGLDALHATLLQYLFPDARRSSELGVGTNGKLGCEYPTHSM